MTPFMPNFLLKALNYNWQDALGHVNEYFCSLIKTEKIASLEKQLRKRSVTLGKMEEQVNAG